MGVWQQCFYLLKRNAWIKWRNRRQSIHELLWPVYFVAILALIRLSVKPETLDEISSFPTQTADADFAGDGDVVYVGYHPHDTQHQRVMNDVRTSLTRFSKQEFGFIPASSPDALTTLYNSKNISIGVIFGNDSLNNYTIRVAPNLIADTNKLTTEQTACRKSNLSDYSIYATQFNCPAYSYITSGFTALQVSIDMAIISVASNQSLSSVDTIVDTEMFPKNEYPPNIQYLQTIVPLYLVLAFSPLVNFLVVNLVTEKEKKIKEGMKMMGLSDIAFWLSWFITYGIIMLFTVLITSVISALAILRNSQFFIIFLMYFGYGFSVISFSFMLTPFFKKAVVAGAIGSFASVIFSVLALLAVYLDVSSQVQWILSLLSPAAFGFGIVQMIALDSHSGGATFSNFVNTDNSSFPPGAGFLMLILDMIIYWLLAVYFDNVIPGEYGQAKSFYFCFLPSYWRKWRKVEVDERCEIPLLGSSSESGNGKSAVVEPVSPELKGKERIRIHGLLKEFVKKRHHCSKESDEIVTAVNGLHLSLYEDQITAILGHNGAGKSTVVACLTGLTSVTSGDASVYGRDITNANDMDDIRKMTGVCPQHDVLFPHVTTKEHLIVFAGIKGVPKHEIDKAVEDALEEVGLTDRADTVATKLSGGQKRKLSVAIALIGNPKVIFLDEPSSGMDPYSRRQLWSLLQSKKAGRVILLTTHFMDEADILADRKAVLSKGKLQVVGSSLFLKSKFGIGYHLGMVVEPSVDINAITNVITNAVPSAELSRSHGMELTYTLPLNDVQRFSSLFTSFEETVGDDKTRSSLLGIQSYGISMTTLEEVFLKLEELEEQESEANDETNNDIEDQSDKLLYGSTRRSSHMIQSNDEETNMNNTDLTAGESSSALGRQLYWQQFLAMLLVRYRTTLRNAMAVFFRIFLPPVLIIVGVVVTRNTVPQPTQPAALQITPSLYLNNENIASPFCSTPLDTNPSLLVVTHNGSNVSDSFSSLLDSFARSSVGYCQPTGSDVTNSTLFNLYLLSNWPHSVALKLRSYILGNETILSQFTALYNDSLVHSLPVAINLMSSAMYRDLTGSPDGINVTNHPFQYENPKLPFDVGSYVSVLLIGMSLVLIPGGFAIGIVADRELRTRHQLQVSGLNRFVYWLAALVSDLSLYLIPVILIIILLPALSLEAFEAPAAMGLTLLVLLLSMPLQALYAYVWSFAFSKAESCQGILPMLISMVGIIPYIVVAIVYPIHQTVAIILHYFFAVLFPPYATLGCLWFITTVYQQNIANPIANDLSAATYFAVTSHITPGLIVMLAEIVILSGLLMLLDQRSVGDRALCRSCFCTRAATTLDVESPGDNLGDDDVKREKQHVMERVAAIERQSGGSPDAFVMMEGVRKEFKDEACCNCKKAADIKVKVAVQNLYLSVNAGEVFGLLGPNGAGKTTAMNVFTGDMTPTEGRVFLINEDITGKVSDAALALGYCPQVDALWPDLTLREHLRTYGWIKGVDCDRVDELVTRFADIMNITEHLDKKSKELSGGTKRKLSFLISMMGGPKVLLLDEPSTGMDPSAKRFLWNIISSCVTDERSAILTTHSMEEADALCSRVGIMVSGALRCVGSTQHLKSKYGAGYHLEMKLSLTAGGTQASRSFASNPQTPTIARQTSALAEVDCDYASESLTSLVSHIKRTFSGALLVECFGDRATFVIPAEVVQSLATVFAALEETKTEFGVEEYSFSQSSLEQVFIGFAKQQREDE